MTGRKQSIYFINLNDNIKELEKHLLPNKNIINLTGVYTDDQILKTRAFRVFAHAEMEFYFEEIASNLSRDALVNWRINHKTSYVLYSLSTFLNVNEKIDLKDHLNNQLEIKFTNSVDKYIKSIIANNGIKKSNLLEMLIPLGINCDELDVSWLNSMDAFGEDRGDFAHQSITSIKISNIINPELERTRVNDIIKEIKIIDNKLIKLK